MRLRPRFFAAFVLLSFVLGTVIQAQDALIAGFNFGQFVGAGAPSLDWQNYTEVGSIEANYREGFAPADSTSGVFNSQQGTDPVIFPSFGFGTWYWDGTNGSDDFIRGVQVDVFELNSAGAQNNATVDGTVMNRGDVTNNGLRFNASGLRFSIVVSTVGFADTTIAPNLSFAAFATGSSAVVEWFANGSSTAFASTQILVGPGSYNATYTVDLPASFYGRADASIQGRVVSGGRVTLDNVQINGSRAQPPVFDTQPADAVALVGQSVEFSVLVSGAATPTYRWKRDGVPLSDGLGVSGSTTATLVLSALTLSRSGTYQVEVNNNGVFAESRAATLKVHQAPAITQQPAAQIANPGQNVSFTVVATGTPAPAYRWQRNDVDLSDGGNISGATTATLTVSGVSDADEGDYRVVVTNAVTSLNSNAVALAVTELSIAPGVSTPPADTIGVVGGGVELSVTASGAPAPTYQWFFNDELLVDGLGISGATSARLVLSGLTADRAGAYKVVITNSAGTIEREAVLTVQTPPQIVSGPGPADRAVVTGSEVAFEIVATGDPAPTYQWLRNGEEIDGETSSTLLLTNVSAADNGSYSVRVSNPANTVESAASVLTVGTATLITSQPQPTIVATGGSVTLSVTATGNPAPSFQWFRDNELLSDATESTLTLNDITALEAGDYTVRVSNLFATEFSQPATVAVAQVVDNARPNATQVYVPGGTLVLGSTSTIDTPLRYEWFRNGRRIAGVSGPTLTLAEADFTDSGVYTVKVYNSQGRLLATRVVSRLSVSVAGLYDVLLHDTETGETVGRLRLDVARVGVFTGRLDLVDGFTRAVRGRLEFPDQPYLGVQTLVLARKALPALELVLSLDAKTRVLGAALSEEGMAGGSSGEAGPRFTGLADWAGLYSLALTPDDDSEPAFLAARIARSGTLSLSGRLADGRRVTASVPSSAAARYLSLLYPYGRGRGFLVGELGLEDSPDGYFADEDSSGLWRWRREARGGLPALDLLLKPTLAP